jgi:aryl-alcohol dehydrogenase-like predicted oxidoreductase
MRYNKFGSTGLFVSEICLGSATFGGGMGFYRDVGTLQQADVDRMLRIAIDAGVNFIDTADAYAEGLSETITGKAIRNLNIPRDEIVVATKVFDPMLDRTNRPNALGSSRYHIMEAVKDSLKRMQLEHIDIYWLHAFDPATPIEETMRAMDTLVKDGLVRYAGVSNWAAWQIATSIGLSERLNLTRVEAHQAYYSIVGRDLEREGIPMLQSQGLGLVVWGPLAGGLLSGKYRDNRRQGRRLRFDFPPVDLERCDKLISAMEPIAATHRVTLAQTAIAWLLHQPSVDSVIVGATRDDQLIENIAAAEIAFSEPEREQLNLASQLAPEYPGWMLSLKGAPRQTQLDASMQPRSKRR